MKKISPLNRRYKRALFHLGLTVLLLGVQVWVWQRIERAAEVVHQRRSEQQQLHALQARVDQIKQTNVVQQGYADQLNVVVPQQAALPQVVERLERLAVESRVQLDIVDISDLPPAPDSEVDVPLKPVGVSIRVLGSAPQLLTMIDAIEHVQEIAIIERWSLNPASVQPLPGTLPGQNLYSLSAHVIFFLSKDH